MVDLRKLDLRRRQLGMSRVTLARRAQISLPTIHRILTGKEPSPSLATLEEIAGALGMSVKVEPTLEVDEFREQQAQQRAAQLVSMVQATMGLESQAVDQQALDRLTKLNVHRLLAGSGRKLWDE